MRGRIPKPLTVKVAEGQPIRRDRVNTEAPEPPRGPMDAPEDLTHGERVVWQHVLANQAPGTLRPVDLHALRRYCWDYAQLLEAQREHLEWCRSKKKVGETDRLKRARNGHLVIHPLFRLINDLQKTIAASESTLGLNPVARERIRTGAQAELFDGLNPSDPWAKFDRDIPSEKAQ